MTRTYGDLTFDSGRFWIANLEPHAAIKLKALFAKIPRTSRGPFDFMATPEAAADLTWFASRYALRDEAGAGAMLSALTAKQRADMAEVDRIMAPDYAPPPWVGLQPGQEVREHQARNCALLQRFSGLLVGDEVGEGKTYSAGAACLLPGALPATIVVPPQLMIQWANKLREFTTLSVHVVRKTTPYALPPVDVRIFSYTQIAGWIDVLQDLGTGLAVFDEAHELRHGRMTAKGQAADRLCEVSRMRLGLTGTPIFNYGPEIWNVMRFFRSEVLGDYDDFYREWCGTKTVDDPEALGMFLREQFALTRKLGSGPKPNKVVVPIDYDAAHLASIEDFAAELARVATTASFEERGRAVRELDMRVRHETGVAKAHHVAQYVRVLVEAGEQVVLFGWHRAVYDIWLKALDDLGVAMFTGSETGVEKHKSKGKFLDGSARVLIMSLRSGAGLDGLQAVASTVVFGELDWSPAMHNQCIGRLNREGQRCWPEPVNAIYLVTDDGSDPPMMDVLGIKAGQAHHILDPGLAPDSTPGDRSVLAGLVQRYLRGKAA